MKIPKELEEWIEGRIPPYKHKPDISAKWIDDGDTRGVFRTGAQATAQEILTNPTKYGLVEISKVRGLTDLLKELELGFARNDYMDEVAVIMKALADWDKIKGDGESGM